MKERLLDLVPGLIGAAMGSIVGYFIYKYALSHGMVAGVVPGAFLGLGSAALSSRPSRLRGLICGVGGLILSLYIEWKTSALAADATLGGFLAGLPQKNWLILLMIVLGTFLAYRLGGDGFKPSFAGKPTPRGGESD
nr:hypothetical protein Hi04_10k_c4998_00033 [uncultured bacterium]